MHGWKSRLVWASLMLAAFAIGLAVYLVSIDFFAADSCLDAGGSFHYNRGECSFTESYEGDVPRLWPF